MISAITSATQAQPVAQSTVVSQPAPQMKSQPTTTDTVQISSASKSALAQALAEATETPAQTAQEARSGDIQAKRLLAKEEAAEAVKS